MSRNDTLIAGQLVSKAPSGGGPFFKHFDLHYTPGKATLGGLRNYKLAVNPLSNESIHGSAITLAHTMYEAKDIKGVVWVSEFGGSAVLTQTMRIFIDQGVKPARVVGVMQNENRGISP